MATTIAGGLFDRPLHSDVARPAIQAPPVGSPALCDPMYDPFCDIDGNCLPGYALDIIGQCEYVTGAPPVTVTAPPTPTENPPTTTQQGNVTVIVNNAVTATDQGVQQVADAVNNAIQAGANAAVDVAKQAADAVASGIAGLAQKIWDGIQAAFGNIGSVLSSIAQIVWDNLSNIVKALGDGIVQLIQNIKDFLTPILTSIASSIDAVVKQIQNINDTLIQPIVTFYNETVKTISTLTVAIEQDLHEGIGGLLKIPGQLADQLGSFDASLQRTIQQLGTTNIETVKTGVTFAGETLPQPFGDAMAKALGGTTLTGTLKTTFGENVSISNETLATVSNEAIAALGPLLKEILDIIVNSFKGTFDQLHADWTDIGSVFVGLLDGILGLLTTVTAMGSLASPLIDAAEQEARKRVPTRKLDPATVVRAMQRGFLTSTAGLAEISTTGLDATRTQVLVDLSVFLADVNAALDWWYRGIITDDDLAANMKDHGITTDDQAAIRAASINLPSLTDLLRWKDFGLISDGEFTSNAKVLRYDDAQIQAILGTYQQRETAQTRAQLDGLLNNSSAGWLNKTLNTPVPDQVSLAGQRAGMHPDLVRYIWLGHWELPSVQQFIESYFRGYRTLTEVQQRMAVDNIPSELWDELIQIQRPLIPYRSIPSLVKNGLMSQTQAEAELAAHGFDLTHVELIMKSVNPPANTTAAKQAADIHTLSIANARELWGLGSLTDDQYTQILEAHGYTAELAAAQLKADAINLHVKNQKQTLADYLAQVEAGAMTPDDAISQLTAQGFTTAQVSKFALQVQKALTVSAKHPTISDMRTFIKAGLLSTDDFKAELQLQGWQEPWLSAWVALETPPASTTNA